MSHLVPSAGGTRGRGYTPARLHEDARGVREPGLRGLRWLTPGWLCVFAALGLSLVGIIAIGTTEPAYAKAQARWLVLGVMAAGIMVVPKPKVFQALSYPFLVVVLLLLVFVLLPWVPESIVRPRKGARRWISLVVTDFQPSEIAKIAYVFALATYLRYRSNHRSFFGLMIPLVATAIPVGLILKEPDLGTSLLFLPTFFAMMIAAGAKLKHVVLIVALGLTAAPMMYPFLEPHQKDRIQAMWYQIKGDRRHVQDIGFQGDKAMTLVGAGGVFGAGEEHARDLIEYNNLPEDHNDMIFAVISCRWGLVGALATCAMFCLLAIGGVFAAGQTRDPFGRLAVVGIVCILFTQMTINIGMTIGLLPITGMTLPFVSYGGSSLVTVWLMIGVILNISLRRDRYMMRKPFEFDERAVQP